MIYNVELEEALNKAIESGKKIRVKWNCGGDEAIITVIVDEEPLRHGNKFGQELEMYLVNYLSLPDAGEFQMEGEGEIIQENDKLFIVYETILKGMMEYENEKFRWKELNNREEEYSGKKILFQN